MIKEQYEQGYRIGKSDARIVSESSKECRWINVNNITHKHDDWIYGYCKGFVEQREKMEIDMCEHQSGKCGTVYYTNGKSELYCKCSNCGKEIVWNGDKYVEKKRTSGASE